tara:strand:+ start:16 stop:612 length:597 start_codon:yes stop_codon:yes gene_type:complete
MNSQEKFWSKKFGDDYVKRNLKVDKSLFIGKNLIKNKIKIKSAIEFGANIGLNLDEIKKIFPNINSFGIEINKNAYKILKKKHSAKNDSIKNFELKNKFDLVIVCLVLIHINPKNLNKIYEKIYDLSNKYIYIEEYFNPFPVKVKYRNFNNKLFKRDFAKDIWGKYPDLKLIDYGFCWSEDPYYKKMSDNQTWFLFKK